jgi:hypothetical protein
MQVFLRQNKIGFKAKLEKIKLQMLKICKKMLQKYNVIELEP